MFHDSHRSALVKIGEQFVNYFYSLTSSEKKKLKIAQETDKN